MLALLRILKISRVSSCICFIFGYDVSQIFRSICLKRFAFLLISFIFAINSLFTYIHLATENHIFSADKNHFFHPEHYCQEKESKADNSIYSNSYPHNHSDNECFSLLFTSRFGGGLSSLFAIPETFFALFDTPVSKEFLLFFTKEILTFAPKLSPPLFS